jgi:acetyl esterase
MPLNPQVEALIKQMSAAGGPPLNEMSVQQARETAAAFAELGGVPDAVASIVDRIIPGPLGDIPVRIYTPAGNGPFPVVLYFHGGGWVLGTLETANVLCSQLSNLTGAVVVSVDYRLAPEHKFPAAVTDCIAATQWVAANAGELCGDPERIAVAGDSAGGNLAAVVAAIARDQGSPPLVFQVLFCPVTDHNFETASYRDNSQGYLLTKDMMKWFSELYLNKLEEAGDWRASPLNLADHSGLPPAYVVTAEFDPLRDEGEAYAELLRRSGTSVTLKRYDGQIHDFMMMNAVLDQARPAVEAAAVLLRDAFAVKLHAYQKGERCAAPAEN